MLDTVKNARVNGLDLVALGEVVEGIEKDAGKAIVGFDVTTRWTGQTRSETIVDGFTMAGERIPRSHKVANAPNTATGVPSKTLNGNDQLSYSAARMRKTKMSDIPKTTVGDTPCCAFFS